MWTRQLVVIISVPFRCIFSASIPLSGVNPEFEKGGGDH